MKPFLGFLKNHWKSATEHKEHIKIVKQKHEKKRKRENKIQDINKYKCNCGSRLSPHAGFYLNSGSVDRKLVAGKQREVSAVVCSPDLIIAVLDNGMNPDTAI